MSSIPYLKFAKAGISASFDDTLRIEMSIYAQPYNGSAHMIAAKYCVPGKSKSFPVELDVKKLDVSIFEDVDFVGEAFKRTPLRIRDNMIKAKLNDFLARCYRMRISKEHILPLLDASLINEALEQVALVINKPETERGRMAVKHANVFGNFTYQMQVGTNHIFTQKLKTLATNNDAQLEAEKFKREYSDSAIVIIQDGQEINMPFSSF